MGWKVTADFSYMLDEDAEYVRGLKERIDGYKKDLEDAQRRLDNAATIEDKKEILHVIFDLTYAIEDLEHDLKWST